MRKVRLGVNIDHAATLRQVRGGKTSYPDLVALSQLALKAGADQITIHLREDRRHIQTRDLIRLSKLPEIPLNLEMAMTPEMFKLASRYRPHWICLVPEKRRELTTEGGLDLKNVNSDWITKIESLQSKGCEISFFIGPDLKQVRLADQLGSDAVEFHTGHWVSATGKRKKVLWAKLVESAELAHSLGLLVHAGHGLDFDHVEKIKELPYLREVNIGHSLICYSLEMGLGGAVKKMRRHLQR